MSHIANSIGGPVSGPAIQVGTLNGSVYLGQAERRTVRLVPLVTSVFQNRRSELAVLDDWAEQGGSRLLEIVGPSGIGKTSLALTWINENRDRFGHAQIAMECGGGPGEGRGRSVEEMCDLYFASTGLATEGYSLGSVSAKIELFRSRIEGEGAALLLDDVQSAAQILPFMSNLPGVLVIVTSRVPIRGGGAAVHRDPRRGTDGGRARCLRRTRSNVRGVPLIAGHAAGLLYDQESLRIGELVARMAEHGRLTALEDAHEDSMVSRSSVFDISYRELEPTAARLYRVLGLHPVRDFDPGLIAAMFAESPAEGAKALAELVKRGVVKADWRGRYLMDDLTYEHAAMVALRDFDPGERMGIHERIADYHLYGAVAASPYLSQRWPLGPLYERWPPFPLPDFAVAELRDPAAERRTDDPPKPMEWVGENLAAIMACMERSGRVWEGSRPAPGYRWQMAEATHGYFTANGRNDERATILAWAEDDARVCQDADAQARIQAQWGEMLLGQGQLDQAEQRFLRSLAAARDGSERRGVAAALEWLGITERRRGNARQALEYFDQARPFLDPTRKRSQAIHHMHRADAFALLGDRAAALDSYAASMASFRELAAEGRRDHANEGKVLMRHGELLESEHPDQTRMLLEEALARFQQAQRPYQEAKTWEALGDLGGDGSTVRRCWQEAVDRYQRHGNTAAAERVRAKLIGTGGTRP